MNPIAFKQIITSAQIANALLVIAFLLLFLAFSKAPLGTPRGKARNKK